MVQPKVISAVCDKEATERGEHRSSQNQSDMMFEETSAAKCEPEVAMDSDSLSSDEDEALAENMAKYFRPIGEEGDAVRVAANASLNETLNIMVDRLSKDNDGKDTLAKLEARSPIPFSTRYIGIPRADQHLIERGSRAELPFVLSLPKISISLTDAEIVEDLLTLAGRDLKQEMDSNDKGPRRVQSTVETEAAAERVDTFVRAAGENGKKRSFNADDVEPAVPRALPAAKIQKSDDESMLSDPALFSKHAERDDIVVCNNCCTNIWLRNSKRHWRQCLKVGAGGEESHDVLEG